MESSIYLRHNLISGSMPWLQKAKIIKDVAAASVLISAITAAVVGVIVFAPKFGEI